MDPLLNPYTPGSGRTPPALVGRDAELTAAGLLIRRTAQGKAGRSLMLYGLRGVGKTVLLNEMRHQATEAGWLTASIEAKQDKKGAEQSLARLGRAITSSARQLKPWRERTTDNVKAAWSTISSFSITAGAGPLTVGIEIAPSQRASSGTLELDLEDLIADIVPALQESAIGMALFIDEIQDLDRVMLEALLATQHRAAQNEWPFYVFGAGLPMVPATLAEARSYAERQFDYRHIDRLSPEEARTALVQPAEDADVKFTEAAAATVLASAQGYPYFLQVYGDLVWQIADTSPVSVGAASAATEAGIGEIDRSLFRSRWDRATPKQKDLMIAMSDDDGPSSISDLATRMGKKRPSDISVFRDELIRKGLIYAPERGYLEFTVPLMTDYVRRQADYSS